MILLSIPEQFHPETMLSNSFHYFPLQASHYDIDTKLLPNPLRCNPFLLFASKFNLPLKFYLPGVLEFSLLPLYYHYCIESIPKKIS